MIIIGDVMLKAGEIPPAQTIVTSPPYWGLRRYPIPDSIFGGDPACPHDFTAAHAPPRSRKADEDLCGGKVVGGQKFDAVPSASCRLCGAWRGQLGQEPTPDLFAAHLAELFTALPLRDDGTLWVNIGDTYISGKGKSGAGSEERQADRVAAGDTITAAHCNLGGKGLMLPKDNARVLRQHNLKPKDKAMIPERLALAMQARGWWYRSEVIWVKKNPLPSPWPDRIPSVTEKVLLFTKSLKYKFIKDGVTVPVAASSRNRYKYGKNESNKYNKVPEAKNSLTKKLEAGKWGWGDTRPINNVWNMATANHRSAVGDHIAPMPTELARRCILLSTDKGDLVLDPFAGTGTTAAAAEREGRAWCMVDMDERLPDFVAESVARLCPPTPLLDNAK